MPNLMLHNVWNISPTVAIGDNPLYESSFNEWMGSGGASGGSSSPWILPRILLKARSEIKPNLMDILNQVDEAIKEHGIIDYIKPAINYY